MGFIYYPTMMMMIRIFRCSACRSSRRARLAYSFNVMCISVCIRSLIVVQSLFSFLWLLNNDEASRKKKKKGTNQKENRSESLQMRPHAAPLYCAEKKKKKKKKKKKTTWLQIPFWKNAVWWCIALDGLLSSEESLEYSCHRGQSNRIPIRVESKKKY